MGATYRPRQPEGQRRLNAVVEAERRAPHPGAPSLHVKSHHPVQTLRPCTDGPGRVSQDPPRGPSQGEGISLLEQEAPTRRGLPVDQTAHSHPSSPSLAADSGPRWSQSLCSRVTHEVLIAQRVSELIPTSSVCTSLGPDGNSRKPICLHGNRGSHKEPWSLSGPGRKTGGWNVIVF